MWIASTNDWKNFGGTAFHGRIDHGFYIEIYSKLIRSCCKSESTSSILSRTVIGRSIWLYKISIRFIVMLKVSGYLVLLKALIPLVVILGSCEGLQQVEPYRIAETCSANFITQDFKDGWVRL